MMLCVEARVYTRVSRLADGRSTKSQETECRAWCKANGHNVKDVYTDDGKSASKYGKKRREWERLKRELEPGDLLVAWEASRTTRDLGEFVVLRDLCLSRGVQLAYSGRVVDLSEVDDSFTAGLDFLLAEREAGKIRDRVMRGQRTSRAEGRPHTRPPWGYRIKEVDGTKVRGAWEPDPIEAPRVREAVSRLLSGETQYAVHKWLEKTGWAPSSPTYLQTCVANPTYAGLRTYDGKVVGKGTWPALITQEQHGLLVRRMEFMKEKYGFHHAGGQEPKYLLSGIAICDKCKEPLRHTLLGGRGSYYQCGRFGHCTRRADAMDRLVEDELFERLAGVNPADHDSKDPAVAAAQVEMDQLNKDLKEWRDLAEKREVTPLSFARMEKSLLARIAELRPKTLDRSALNLDYRAIERNWKRWPMRRRREVIRAFFTVTVVPGSRSRRDGRVVIDPI